MIRKVKPMNSIGIYIHIPFCASKCPYCDFHSGSASEETKTAYTNALIRTISEYEPQNISADTIYFGGGTPPLLGTENLSRVLHCIYDSFHIADNAEITMEANSRGTVFLHFLS